MLIRKGGLLDLIIRNKEELVGDMKVGSALGAVTVRWWSSGS